MKRIQKKFDEDFEHASVALFSVIRYSIKNDFSQLDEDTIGIMASQVTNYLLGEDITKYHGAPEFQGIYEETKHLIKTTAESIMESSKEIRELCVATLRMRTVIHFYQQGEKYFNTEEKKRYEKILAEYGKEFPKEINPADYTKIVNSFYQTYNNIIFSN